MEIRYGNYIWKLNCIDCQSNSSHTPHTPDPQIAGGSASQTPLCWGDGARSLLEHKPTPSNIDHKYEWVHYQHSKLIHKILNI